MSSAYLSNTSAKTAPIGPNAGAILDEWACERGLTPLTKEELSALPPWTEEEAAAFERTINELFECVETSPGQP